MPEPWSELEFWQVCEIKHTSRRKEQDRSMSRGVNLIKLLKLLAVVVVTMKQL
jgi:hypothetical protein